MKNGKASKASKKATKNSKGKASAPKAKLTPEGTPKAKVKPKKKLVKVEPADERERVKKASEKGKATSERPEETPRTKGERSANVTPDEKPSKSAPTDERETLSTPKKKRAFACSPMPLGAFVQSLLPLDFPASCDPCVTIVPYRQIKELQERYPQGIPEGVPERFWTHKHQTCGIRLAAQMEKNYTAEGRDQAKRRLRDLASWYEFAATDYVHAPESERIHRTRLRDLARILTATVRANWLDNDIESEYLHDARKYLDDAATFARRFLAKLDGKDHRTFVRDIVVGERWERHVVENCDAINFMLMSVHAELDRGAKRGTGSLGETAKNIAVLLVIYEYEVFLDRLKDPTKFEPTEQTVEHVAKRIESILEPLRAKEWPTLETAKNVVRAALRALGDKNPYDFFSNFDKAYAKHRAKKQDK